MEIMKNLLASKRSEWSPAPVVDELASGGLLCLTIEGTVVRLWVDLFGWAAVVFEISAISKMMSD